MKSSAVLLCNFILSDLPEEVQLLNAIIFAPERIRRDLWFDN